MLQALQAGEPRVECSLDLGLSIATVDVDPTGWHRGQHYPFVERCRDRTVYHWTERGWQPVARFNGSLIKLVPTEWGPPTFEIDGIKMLPTAKVSPYADAERKVALVQPKGKTVLDTCGGLGYFAAWCIRGGAARVLSFEKNPDVSWLRSVNPWSPVAEGVLELRQGDIAEQVPVLADASVDAILHDPPRFGIAGELYSQSFYDQLSRVLKRKGRLFHYTGTPNRLTTGRDVPNEVAKRLKASGFATELIGDGVLATKR